MLECAAMHRKKTLVGHPGESLSRWPALALVIGVWGAPRCGHADRLVLDPAYPDRGRQGQHLARRVDRLRSPTVTFPALVAAGETFAAMVTEKAGPDGRPLLPREPGQWLVYLRAGAAVRACAVERVGRAKGRWLELQVRVPPDLARDV